MALFSRAAINRKIISNIFTMMRRDSLLLNRPVFLFAVLKIQTNKQTNKIVRACLVTQVEGSNLIQNLVHWHIYEKS